MKISIIVLNWNGKHYLEECFNSIINQSREDIEIICVDNGSTDGSIEFMQKKFPQVKLICNGKNLGFSKGVNVGISAARGKYIALLNNDVVLDPHWIRSMEEILDKDDCIGIVACKMLLYQNKEIIDSAGNFFQIAVTRSRGRYTKDKGKWDHETRIFGACAGAAMYRRSMLDIIGLFDEDFFMSHEDNDLSFRANLAGFKCIYTPKAVCFHHDHGTYGMYTNTHIYFYIKNLLHVPIKNIPTLLWIKYFHEIYIKTLREIIHSIAVGRGNSSLKALTKAFLQLPIIIKKRIQIQSHVKVSLKEIEEIITNEAIEL